MKKVLFIILSLVAFECAQEKKDVNYVLNNFAKNTNNLNRVEYYVERIDTFVSGGTVWNKKGYALIERKKDDKLFGFTFFSERYDIDKQFIYDGKNEFTINKNEKTYELSKPGIGFLGSPGGQMIAKELFAQDTTYQNVKLLSENSDVYLVEYRFEDDTVYNVKNQIKLLEINKDSFLPQKIKLSYEMLGNRGVHQISLSNIRINSDVNKSIDQIKRDLYDYKLMAEEISNSKILIDSKAPLFTLSELFNSDNKIDLPKDKIVLLDFWEVWCSPCIKSLLEIEKISKRFADSIIVVGIITDDIDNSKKLVNQKNLTFTNIIGNEKAIKDYGVNSFPRYFLINKDGFIKKEYFGFSPQIKEDIIELLKE